VAASAAPDDGAAIETVEAIDVAGLEALAPEEVFLEATAAEVEVVEAAPEPVEAPVEKPVARAKPVRRVSSRPRDKRSPFLVLADYEQRSLAHVAGPPAQPDAPGLWRGVADRARLLVLPVQSKPEVVVPLAVPLKRMSRAGAFITI